MAVVSVGLDVTQLERLEATLERRGRRFLDRIFTPAEQAYCERRAQRRITHYAGRFAAKEAAMKALGTGWAQGVRWVDLEVRREPGQAPELHFHGVAGEIAARRSIARAHLAITHDAGIAVAVVVAEST